MFILSIVTAIEMTMGREGKGRGGEGKGWDGKGMEGEERVFVVDVTRGVDYWTLIPGGKGGAP